jgi:hypothetical protein
MDQAVSLLEPLLKSQTKKIEEKPEEKSKRKSDQKFYNKSVDILYKERQQENKGTSRWDA